MEQVMLDMIPTGAKAVCHVSQYDIGRTIRFNLISGCAAYTLAGTETIKVYIKKPDGTTAERNIANTSSTYVDWVTGEGDCDQAGKCECELVITSGTTVIGSKNFTVKIEEDPYNEQGVVTETAGPAVIATFTTNVVDLLQEVKCSINPIQDLHGEDRPYPAGGGVNIWDEEWEVGGINSSDGEPSIDNSNIRSKNYIPISPDTDYYIYDGTSNAIGLYAYDASKNYIGSYNSGSWTTSSGYAGNRVIRTPVNCAFLKFATRSNYGTTYNNDISINNPSTDHDYHPYENVCPITGFDELNVVQSGINLWDEEWQKGVISSGIFNPSGDRVCSKNFISVKPSTRLYIASNIAWVFFYSDANESSYISNGQAPITTPANCKYIKFYTTSGYGQTYNNDLFVSLEDTTYHPYTGKLIKLEFDDTVYLAEVSCLNGVWKLKLLGAEVDLGDLTYTRWPNDSDYYIFYAVLVDKENMATNTGICSIFPILATNATGAANAKGQLTTDNTAILSKNTSSPYIFIRCDTYTDANTFKTAMSGQKLVYQLATSIEITLNETEQFEALLGVNNVWHDGNGNTEVKYLYNA